MIQRVSDVITPRQKIGGLSGVLHATGASLGTAVEQFERVMPKSQAEVSVTQQRLIRAGYREDSAVKIFYGAKLLTPLALCFVALVTGLWRPRSIFCHPYSPGAGVSGAGLLARAADCLQAEEHPPRPARCARSAGDLHRGRP